MNETLEETNKKLQQENAALRRQFEAAWMLLECVASIAEDYRQQSITEEVLEQSERNRDFELDMLLHKIHDFSARMFGD